jgi:hypothetical protein
MSGIVVSKAENPAEPQPSFSEWLAESDPDYHIAQELYYKLEKREDFMRSFGVGIGK